jgi:chorismate synthase
MFDSIEGTISLLAFSVPAVKGIEFGRGFDIAKMRGSSANDSFYYDGDKVKTKTNNNGGINGGISNGMPITFRVAVKPTPSIAKEQDTIDLINKKNVKLKIEGRHDACIVPRAVPVIEAITAIAIYDMM